MNSPVQLVLGNSAILAYRRLPYKAWYAIAEFVDNATDAYLRVPNQQLLDEAYQKENDQLTVEIKYDKDEAGGLLEVIDNSMGMSRNDLAASLVVGEPPVVSAGRSEFGMGMKTAGIWFADYIEIITKKLGETAEYSVIIDVPAFVEGQSQMSVKEVPKHPDMHYTIIRLTGLKRRLGQKAWNNVERHLASIYRIDLREKRLKLVVKAKELESPVSFETDDAFMLRVTDGKPVKKKFFDLDVNGKKVSGWAGVLAPGYSARNNAGFCLIRNDRSLSGSLDSWRPQEIFGDARNDTINQRMTGEIYLDHREFKASHTKDGVSWEDDDEEILGEALLDFCKQHDMLTYARKKTGARSPQSGSIEAAEARAQLASQLKNRPLQDAIKLIDVKQPEVVELMVGPLKDIPRKSSPIVAFEFGPGRTAFLYEADLSVNDPYFEYDVTKDSDLQIIFNAAHPAFSLLEGAEARLAHYHHVVLDAIAEWKCAQFEAPPAPEVFRLLKSELFAAVAKSETDI